MAASPKQDVKLHKLIGENGNPTGLYDIAIGADGDIETEDSLDSTVLTLLLTDARASASEVRTPNLRRGWIGDEFTPGYSLGSTVWTFKQSRRTRVAAAGIASAAQRGLAPLVEDGIAESVSASAALTPDGVALSVELRRPTGQVERRYFKLWEGTGR